MRAVYRRIEDDLKVYERDSRHESPHLHRAMECILITEGTLEVGIGTEYYHMEKGDFTIIFPEMIHHYQVFDENRCRAIHLLAAPSLAENYLPLMRQYCPEQPIIPGKDLHPDIVYAMHSLMEYPVLSQAQVIHQSFVRIILARAISYYHMVEKPSVASEDLVYQTVRYIAAHYTEPVSLSSMAQEMGYSPYALSRIFQATFHMNFNRYLNEQRLDYVVEQLRYTNDSVLEIAENSGFESQRTFNRAFKDRFHMTPREYRQQTLKGIDVY